MRETAHEPDRQDIDAGEREPVPDYILKAAEAAGEWWAKSDRDPRIKFTPPTIVKLLTALRDGNHYEPACALAGVTYSQFRNWMNKAEDEGEDGPFGAVARAVKVAEAEAEAESVRYVRAASRDPRFWAAGMTFLERRHPDRWRRPSDNTAVQVHVGVAIGVQASEAQRRAIVPQVVSQPLSPTPEPLTALSPAPERAVSDVQGEAKATPMEGVSPPNVA